MSKERNVILILIDSLMESIFVAISGIADSFFYIGLID